MTKISPKFCEFCLFCHQLLICFLKSNKFHAFHKRSSTPSNQQTYRQTTKTSITLSSPFEKSPKQACLAHNNFEEVLLACQWGILLRALWKSQKNYPGGEMGLCFIHFFSMPRFSFTKEFNAIYSHDTFETAAHTRTFFIGNLCHKKMCLLDFFPPFSQ